MTIDELLAKAAAGGENVDYKTAINELKRRRYVDEPDTDTNIRQLDPLKHDVFDKSKRKDKFVKVDRTDPNESGETTTVTSGVSNAESAVRIEPVSRIALAIQRLIVKRATAFIFGNPVELDADAMSESQKLVLKAVEKVMHDVKDKTLNRKVAREMFSCTEVAELWYPVQKKHTAYGFNSDFKLRCAIFSPLHGDSLYPYFDETGDMIAFSREFSITDAESKTTIYFETYTAENHYMWNVSKNYELVEGYPKQIAIGKIPVVFGHQPQVEWADVQNLIDRLEKLLSNFADTNDYHASPKIVVKGTVNGFSKKGEAGGILELEGDNASATYLSWANAPESVRLEIDTLLRMIYTITQTPDISFEAMKGIGNVATKTLKLMFMDAHLKVADHQEVFDEYLQRRINIVKAFIGKFNTKLETEAEDMIIEPIITPYVIRDESAELKIWTDANGGKPVMSQKASFAKAKMTRDTDADFEQWKEEEKAEKSFTLNEPTV